MKTKFEFTMRLINERIKSASTPEDWRIISAMLIDLAKHIAKEMS